MRVQRDQRAGMLTRGERPVGVQPELGRLALDALDVEEGDEEVPHVERPGVGLGIPAHDVGVGVVPGVREPPDVGQPEHHERRNLVPAVGGFF